MKGWVGVPALAAVLVAAAFLRLWRLDDVPAGAWIDEAIEGLQAAAWREGERLPDTPANPFPRWPLWCAIEAAATSLGGDMLATIRAPAAAAGILTVVLAFFAGRALAGTVGGLSAAAFLAGSFWHVQMSRMALPCILAVAEGLVVAWLLLAPRPSSWRTGIALAALSAEALYGYAASLATLAATVALLGVRGAGPRDTRPARSCLLAYTIGTAALAVAVSLWPPSTLRRSVQLAAEVKGTFSGQAGAWLASVAWTTAPGWGYWRAYPPGAARFTPPELALVMLGTVSIVRSTTLAGWQKRGWAAWAAVSILPELLAGEAPHLVRGLPQLAPAALAAGAGAAALVAAGRVGPVLVAAVLTANTAWAVHRLCFRFAADPLVAHWYLRPDRDAARAVLTQAERGPVALTPVFTYDRSPVVLFHLAPAIRRGVVAATDDRPARISPLGVFADPLDGQPASVLYASTAPWRGRRHLWLVHMEALLEPGHRALAAARYEEARRHYEHLLRMLPESAAVRASLGIALVRLGRMREAVPHLEFALRHKPERGMEVQLEDALARARSALPPGRAPTRE